MLRKAVLDEAGGEAPRPGAYGEAAIAQGLAITAAVQSSLLRKAVLDESGGEPPLPGAFGEEAHAQGIVPNASIQMSLIRKAVDDKSGGKPSLPGAFGEEALAQGIVPNVAVQFSLQRGKNVARLSDYSEGKWIGWVPNLLTKVRKILQNCPSRRLIGVQ